MVTLPQDQLDALWETVNRENRDHISSGYQSILETIVNEGWMYEHQLEDICYASDPRLVHYRSRLDLVQLSKSLGYHWFYITRKPLARSNNTMLNRALSAADCASFLIDLENIGFGIDPSFIVAVLETTIKKQKIITDSELRILWFKKCRYKREISFNSDEKFRELGKISTLKLRNGFKADLITQKDGATHSLSIRGPKYRKKEEPVETKCAECGFTWWRGDPDSSAAHRKEHKHRMLSIDPQPHEKMALALAEENDPELVTNLSSDWKHKEMSRRAWSFKREKKYDFVQWGESGSRDTDPNARGFLFADDDRRIVGAAAFRLRDTENQESFWGLQWVWIAPKYRRSGILDQRWPKFREKFGDFWVESPVSESMQRFLKKRGESFLMDYPTERIAKAETN